ncbi:MAG: ATP-binding protein [Pseudomonadota bacterium]|nr:ATP-binding protein [Pseudomonadota bacterium]
MFLNDDITRIFPPFARLDFSRKRDFGGVGLGLAVPHSIISRHDEHIRVDESKRHDARFILS